MPQRSTRKQIQEIHRNAERLRTISLGCRPGQIPRLCCLSLNQYRKAWALAGCVAPTLRFSARCNRLDASATSHSVQWDKQRVLLLPARTLCQRPWGEELHSLAIRIFPIAFVLDLNSEHPGESGLMVFR